MLQSLLIANRGEIALRIVRACRDLGVRSVAVFSDADRLSPHVIEADEAYPLGPAPAAESYLRIDRILEVARAAHVQGVHPGYGFLAEREPFATAVEKAGLVFVGPRPWTIGAMGDKTEARRLMRAAGVPVVPGLVESLRDRADAVARARDLGFPLLLKAAAGGGGKGMRVVRDADELPRAFEAAGREAAAAFGDGSLYLERYLDRPRHVEIQVLGDEDGHVIHLGERECSIQRRHQKLVEEAPSTVLTDEQRDEMGRAAVLAAESVEYRGAGTVEFLYDDGRFHFLEMNTRLQVEHPVTELVTGLDLVEWQLRVAGGEPLPVRQEDMRLVGHALECRITAEDPSNGFLPSAGVIGVLRVPAGPGVRWDGGVEEGSEVGTHYDSLLGKLVTFGATRSTAVRRMARALDELVVDGVSTSTPFHRRVMDDVDFLAGRLHIRYVDEHPRLLADEPGDETLRAAAVATALLEHDRKRIGADVGSGNTGVGLSSWRTAGWPWRGERRP